MTSFDNVPLVLTPFADSDASKDFSFFESGITRQMTVPTENGGARFTRHQMNGIGYLATLGAFLDRVGYPYGRERLDPSSFGGYPKGAILMTQENNRVREYISLVDNNTHPLPTEDEDGTYVGNEWWAPTIPTDSVSFYPSFANPKYVTGATLGPIGYNGSTYTDLTVSETGWYCIERVFRQASGTQFKSILDLANMRLSLQMNGDGLSNGWFVVAEPLDGLLGEKASCIIPLSAGAKLRFSFYSMYFTVPDTKVYCDVLIRKLEAMELQ